MPDLADQGSLTARVLMSVIFIGGGVAQITDPSKILHMIRDRGIPLGVVFYAASSAILLAGAVSILLGWHTRWGAAALLVFILPATFLFHLRSDQADMELFTRDLAIAGGLGLLLQHGPGALSLDARARRRRVAVS